MYSKEDLIKNCISLYHSCPGNEVDIPDIGLTKLYDEPLVGFASAEDELFDQYKSQGVIGDMFLPPTTWLPEAKTVLSVFFPITEAICKSNVGNGKLPSTQWLYARIEGQAFITEYISRLQRLLADTGMKTCVPSLDERFEFRVDQISRKKLTDDKETDERQEDIHFNSRWSERHAAYVCGLGTFGLSRGLITEKGMAGRFTSIIIDEAIEPTQRQYKGVYDNCINCGACAVNCPPRAVTVEYGKNNIKCHRYVEAMKKKFAPRYGCGKCQTGVPCERCNPAAQRRD